LLFTDTNGFCIQVTNKKNKYRYENYFFQGLIRSFQLSVLPGKRF
jgi:hypothetical protein